jgi:hypothetical protein
MRRCSFLSLLAVLLVLLFVAGGCATNHPVRVDRPAVDAPEQFLVETDRGLAAPSAVGASPGKLVDPRNQNHLQLIRSVNAIGDYQAPPGAYGLRQGELLRVDSLGKPLGIVPR